jgi:hypothetical protein
MELASKWCKHEQKIAFSNSICRKIKVPKIVIFLYETQESRCGKQAKIKGMKFGESI